MRIGSFGRSAVWLAATMLLAGCVPRLQQPEVRLSGVRVGGIGFQGGLLYARLSVSNPNSFALQADRLTYDLDLSDRSDAEAENWIKLAQGSFDQGFRVEARDTASVEIPIEFTFRGMGGALRSLIETGTFHYRVSGVVHLERPLSRDLPYRRRGVMSLGGGHETDNP